MPINERGEFIREFGHDEEKNKDVMTQLAEWKFTFQHQNNHPTSSKQPEDVFYWSGERLARNRELLNQMQEYSQANGVTEIIDPRTQETTNLQEFLDKVRRSIAYSEQIGSPTTGDTTEAKKRLKDKLLGNDKS